MFKKYTAYYQHNPHHYWFRRKIWGWGWVPVTWQGWIVILLWLAAVLLLAFMVDEHASLSEVAVRFILPVVFLTSLLIYVCYKKGEKPKWQWGLPKDE